MSYKVRNFNYAYELLLQAMDEFSGFVAGPGVNNQLFTYGAAEDIFNTSLSNIAGLDTSDENLKKVKKILVKVLDRTTGTYFMSHIANNMDNIEEPPEDIGRYVEFHYEDETNQQSAKPSHFSDVYNPNYPDYAGMDDTTKKQGIRINTAIGEYDTSKMKASKLSSKQLEDLDLSNTDASGKEAAPQYIFVVGDSDNDVIVDGILNSNPGDPHKYSAPGLCAIVNKHTDLNFSGRKANHLNVFFNAITPIEMSRCTPFISMFVMTTTSKKKAMNKMNMVSFMRFIKADSEGDFVLDETIGMSNSSPAYGDQITDFFGRQDATTSTKFTYMDTFTSPQLASNADINGKSSYAFKYDKAADKKLFNAAESTYTPTPILEPIAPFLTLKSINVQIVGTSFGMMSTKMATLELVLHDRSRMKDLAPLLASDQFSNNKIFLEYGWSHPDSGPASGNTIGNYLDALRDTGFYQVISTNYSFSAGNTVNISVKLACSGFQEMKNVSAACGVYAPLRIFSDYIDDIVFSSNDDEEEEIAKAPELRQKLKVQQAESKSGSGITKFEFIKNLYEETKDASDEDKIKAITGFVASILLVAEPGADKEYAPEELIELIKAGNAKDRSADAISNLFAKLYALKDQKTSDPFCCSLISESELVEKIYANGNIPDYSAITQNDIPPWNLDEESKSNANISQYVTLGKVLMNFIGHPMAKCGLYDEVQMVFYPINHHAGAARSHTTASFPILFSDLEREVKRSLTRVHSMTVHAFFTLIERVVKNRFQPAYGIKSQFAKELKDFNKLPVEDQKKIAKEEYKSAKDDIEALKLYKENLTNNASGELGDSLDFIYKKDGAGILSEKKFIKPNLSMYFEVCPVVDESQAGFDPKERIAGLFGLGEDEEKRNSNGLKLDKTILRIHVYDEESITKPSVYAINSIMIEGSTGELMGKTDDQGIQQVAQTEQLGDTKNGPIINYVTNMTFGEVKQFVKRSYPSITYGSSSGVIKSIDISGNTSGTLANILIAENFMNNRKGGVQNNDDPEFEEVIMFPSTIKIEMLGMPMITRGENIFIDFGTDTSIDNVYIVKTVNHTLGSGQFTTSIDLVASNQGEMKSFKSKLKDKAVQLLERKR